MVKTFVTSISLQSKAGLLKIFYHPEDFKLEKNRETSFPIIPVIADKVKENDEIKIIAVRSDNADTPDNYEVFLGELSALGISADKVTEISVAENQSKKVGLRMLLNILQEIPEDSLVYADITFGTKPMSAIVLYAMSFIEKLKDSEVEGIFYGEIPREKGQPLYEKAALYDLTAFKYLSGVIEELNNLEVSDPLASLQRLIDM